jgi:plastocyanin
MQNKQSYIILVTSVAVLLLLAAGGFWMFSQTPSETTFVIPQNTAARVAAGETVEVLPTEIKLKQYDTLIIRNEDSEEVQIGPFLIQPGQSFIQQYKNAGTYDLMCSIHIGENLRVIVD